ncbi:MAG: hypothetical protein H7257_03810 [Taibaiella sp.]|nr:hypothetical protein [Taibaiella sp.]
MYQFRITKQERGGYRFELSGIKMLVEDFEIKNDKHILTNPGKTIAFFYIDNNLYGVTNDPNVFNSAEDFYDAMSSQYQVFAGVGRVR